MAEWLDELVAVVLAGAAEALDLAKSAEEAGEILAYAVEAGVSATALGDLVATATRRWGNLVPPAVSEARTKPPATLPQDVIDSILAEDAARNEPPSQNAGVPFPSQLREAAEIGAAAVAAQREARIAAASGPSQSELREAAEIGAASRAAQREARIAAAEDAKPTDTRSGQFRNRPGSADTSVAPVVPQESLEDRRTRARAKVGQSGSDSPGTYEEILEAEIERLASSRAVLIDNRKFLDAINTANGVREATGKEAKQAIHIVMAGLRKFDPNVNLYDLVTGTTSVSALANGNEIIGTYGFQELMDLLDANDMLSLDAPSDFPGLGQVIDSDTFNEFNAAAQKFKIEAGLVPGGLNGEKIARGFSQIDGWTDALESEEPERFMPALEEMEESGSGSTGYSEFIALEPPKVTKQVDRDVADHFVKTFSSEAAGAEYSGPRPVAGSGRAGQAGSVTSVTPDAASRVRGVAEIQADIARLEERKEGIRSVTAGQQLAQQMDELKAELEAESETAALAPSDEDVLNYLASLNGTPTTLDTTTPYTGAPRLTAAEKTAADRNEVHALLQEQFGGFAFFLQQNESQLNVGLTANGTIVAADDPTASTVKNVLDVIAEKGIVALDRVKGVLQKTEWWQTTDTRARQFDAQFGELSEPGKQEYLEPILDNLSNEAQFLGGEEYAEAFDLDPERARRMAEQIAREGKERDVDYIRGMMVAESQFAASGSALSSFGEARDEIKKLGADYYVGVSDSDAAGWAEDIYVGDRDVAWMTQYFKNQATARFPSLDHAINTLQITPGEYFAPYKYEIEQMLDRDVDMMREFAEVIEFIPAGAGGDVARPMTMGEARTFVRGTNEWQNSTQGQDQASALAFAIGNTFGEVA